MQIANCQAIKHYQWIKMSITPVNTRTSELLEHKYISNIDLSVSWEKKTCLLASIYLQRIQ